MMNTIEQLFAKAIGHPLQKVIASVHLIDRETLSDVPLCLWLFFERVPGLRLRGSADGWHLEADEALPDPVDMGESGGIVLRDISRTSIFRQMLGKKLQGAWAVESAPEGEVVGMRFDFGLPITPIVLNWGDELYIGDTYPPDADEAELLEVPMWPAHGGPDESPRGAG